MLIFRNGEGSAGRLFQAHRYQPLKRHVLFHGNPFKPEGETYLVDLEPRLLGRKLCCGWKVGWHRMATIARAMFNKVSHTYVS